MARTRSSRAASLLVLVLPLWIGRADRRCGEGRAWVKGFGCLDTVSALTGSGTDDDEHSAPDSKSGHATPTRPPLPPTRNLLRKMDKMHRRCNSQTKRN